MNLTELIGSLHPAIVHIPVGLLTVYAVAEALPLTLFYRQESFRVAKGMLVIVGVLGAMAALASGDAAGELRSETPLLEVHEAIATITTGVFGVLALLYALIFLETIAASLAERRPIFGRLWSVIPRIITIVDKMPIRSFVATIALLLIVATGALGGALGHGPDADPLIAWVVRLFGL
jgi:hypothetical protein